jgi:tRNA (cytidine/uridine-2'-O-)-methyltransferase
MFSVILFEPEIPPNTGNIIRMCANAGAALHLIQPLGFDISEAKLRRAGLDYHELTSIRTWPSLDACLAALSPARWFAVSTRGVTRYDRIQYAPGDAFVFGPESRGLPAEVLESCARDRRLRIPMRPDNRSLNLSNAAAVLVFEAWRQQSFAGGS